MDLLPSCLYIQDKVQEAGAMTDTITIANVDAMYQVVAQEFLAGGTRRRSVAHFLKNYDGDGGMRLTRKLTRMALVGSSGWWWGLFTFPLKLILLIPSL